MATEFNFKRAFDEKYYPLFQEFSPEQLDLFDTIRKIVVTTENFNIQEIIHDQILSEKLNALGTPTIEQTALIVYRLGYYCYDREKITQFQEKGFYWKFQDICDQWLIHNGHEGSRLIESTFCPADEFRDHVVGTNYDHDEIARFLYCHQEIPMYPMGIYIPPNFNVINANFRVVDSNNKTIDGIKSHPFMITNEHIIKATGRGIDGSEAPCGICKHDVKSHISDVVCIVNVPKDSHPNYIHEVLLNVSNLIEDHNKTNTDKMMIDGFAIRYRKY